jgi:hypothetical protein
LLDAPRAQMSFSGVPKNFSARGRWGRKNTWLCKMKRSAIDLQQNNLAKVSSIKTKKSTRISFSSISMIYEQNNFVPSKKRKK